MIMKFTEILEDFLEAQNKFLRQQDQGRLFPAIHETRTLIS
jgi:hypothetical protein